MEINLSKEMIEKITCAAFGRFQDLRRKIEKTNSKEATTEREKAFKNLYLKDLNKALSESEEVHSLFLELLEQIENE